MTKTRFYQCWRDMIDRTSRKKNHAYNRYGNRGIKVCERWQSFENFMEDIYESYIRHSKKHGEQNTTLDRLDNNGDYNLDNCRWATHKQQAYNRSNCLTFTIDGKELTVKKIAEKYNLNPSAVRHRIERNWSEEKMKQPLRGW